MDVSQLLEIKAAPRAVFERLETHRQRVRFQVRSGNAWVPVTWGQFAQQIRGVARWLIEREVDAGERIAIYAPNSVAWASAALGAQTAGAVFVPIYPASTPEQVAYILEHAECRFVFVAGNEQIARLDKARSQMSRPVEAVALEGASWAPDAPIGSEGSIDLRAASGGAARPGSPDLAI
nr:AMP-binding protein [Deltaproteobacteria bacterium]